MTDDDTVNWTPLVLTGIVVGLVVMWSILTGRILVGSVVVALVTVWSILTGRILAELDWDRNQLSE